MAKGGHHTALPKRLLIANRGEIACRIIRTAKALGIETVAVYSDADARSLHARLADRALRIGPAPAAESYLDAAALIAAATSAQADAIHPGYGFLSENAQFAEACSAAGVAFIGPPAAAIRAMGSKSASKALMEKAGVPVTPGYHGEAQDLATLSREADRIGYPLLIKASAGGGGRGMRRVNGADEFPAALEACQREAAASFKDDRVILERFVEGGRHVEVQVFADRHGHCIHLGERDCSTQRRHQKVVEEAPAPGLAAAQRAAMGEAAVRAALAVGYVGAGTVEFMVSADGSFYFMEMNTRLQVEHPVTEMITGIDLVGWQLTIAAGEALPLTQEGVRLSGHAIEARIYAEDPARGFMPSSGRIVEWLAPPESTGLRIDSGYGRGDLVTPFYDAMLAKVVVHAESRESARLRLLGALEALSIVGPRTNIEFLHALLRSPSFAEPGLDTGLIEREWPFICAELASLPSALWPLAATSWVATEPRSPSGSGWPERHSPWAAADRWRIQGASPRRLSLQCGDEQATIYLQTGQGSIDVRVGARSHHVAFATDPGQASAIRATIDGLAIEARAVRAPNGWLHLFHAGRHFIIQTATTRARRNAEASADICLRSPMPGRVSAIYAVAGKPVKRGERLLTLEAMKMEHTLAAPSEGVVRAVRAAPGGQVAEGDELLLLAPGESPVD